MKNTLLLSLCFFAFFSCQQADYNATESGYTSKEADYEEIPQTAEENTPQQDNLKLDTERKLIKNAFLKFEVSNLKETHNKIENATKKWAGYLANDEEQKYYNRNTNILEIRLPAENFDHFLAEISTGVSHFDEKNITVKDVTEQFVDLEARLKTKKELEKRYLALLAKANSVTEILEIEREIANLRGDIEVMEGRFRLMKNQISFSTIYIEYYVTVEETYEEDSLGQKLANNFLRGWNNTVDFFVGLVSIWPFLILLIVIAFLIKRRFSSKRNK